MKKYSGALIVLILILAVIHISPNGTTPEAEMTTIATLLGASPADRLTTNLQKWSRDIADQANAENVQTTKANAAAPSPAEIGTTKAPASVPAVTRTTVAVSRQAKSSAAPTAKTPSIEYRSSSQQSEMLAYINAARAQANLAPLVLNTKLSKGAYLKSKDMAVEGYFSHYSPTYGSPVAMMNSLGIAYDTAAENIAKNLSVKAAQQAFMDSPPHKANILNSDITKVGLGFYQSGKYLYVTQWFTN